MRRYPLRTTRQQISYDEDFAQLFATTQVLDMHNTFLSQKEHKDRELSLQLRAQGKITTAGEPFELSDATEIDSLIGRGIIIPIQFDPTVHKTRIFGLRLVREIKDKATDVPFEKSRLVVQGHSDHDKRFILTQSPTILRCSQRLILAIAPMLQQHYGFHLALRDITQAYTQSATPLYREILARPPREIKNRYPEGTIFRVMRPLYGIPEAGAHWFLTYQNHHREQLGMDQSSYDPCLMVSHPDNTAIGIIGMQTDDTIQLGNNVFMEREDHSLQKHNITAKPKTILTDGSVKDFNGLQISIENGTINTRQKGQANNLQLVDADNPDRNQQYIQQRARGAYLASICQPEAATDYSVAAQAQLPTDSDIIALNKRIQWQLDHKDRGLRFLPLAITDLKMFIFADGSFANNQDLTSQIGYIIVLANEIEHTDEQFKIQGNIIHWSSTKCKRVTRSVLASEIYGTVSALDMGYVLTQTVNTIVSRLQIPTIPLIMCTDSYSLYECLVKLGSTTEKRLMIDIMAIRQSYERREISEIRWINGSDNPADAMTKVQPNKVLERLVSTNQVDIRIEGWVDRE
ncbi:hypothetical protein DCS_04244 [Drechmeria coniospora]|uniref:Reverse transcriptase Ty1/copia-type domain-containing protein n=1 Tax=Drechmeria coniospora TaxID=98403 RepID=A0A151GJG4_DRECN|nr:hypothetical protein DCS_04244 [Drechmeria coniospora]KYK57237.1 hypothetical protein DCS_04244 [Drechmeria coniospora]